MTRTGQQGTGDMAAQPQPDPPSEAEELEAAADQAIAACNGDARSAIRALILANRYYEVELAHMARAISAGYARGRARKPKAEPA